MFHELVVFPGAKQPERQQAGDAQAADDQRNRHDGELACQAPLDARGGAIVMAESTAKLLKGVGQRGEVGIVAMLLQKAADRLRGGPVAHEELLVFDDQDGLARAGLRTGGFRLVAHGNLPRIH